MLLPQPPSDCISFFMYYGSARMESALKYYISGVISDNSLFFLWPERREEEKKTRKKKKKRKKKQSSFL
jgi:hypothetical protein